MISVPNHRLRLSGNRTIIAFLVVFGIFSCAAPRTVSKKPPVTTPPTDQEGKIRVYDPKTDTYILIPRDAVKVDTVQWTEDPAPPVITDKDIRDKKPEKKTHYDVALLMPLNSTNAPLFSEQQDSKLNRFIQFYAGIRMALDEIDSIALPVSFHSYDVEGSATAISDVLKKPGIREADVIVGPYEKADIEMTASYGLNNEIMVVSPWIPAFSGSTENPFFIQMYPGLGTHAEVILEFIKDEMPDKHIYVVSRNNPAEIKRMHLFTKSTALKANELIIKDSSPDLVNTDLNTLLSEETGTIFILPYYAKADESFVNSFMRKLHADKDTKEAIVFGLPQWIGYTNLNANYMESLSLHLSISSFIDTSHPSYTSFRTKFFRKFHAIPDLQAFLGYDMVRWIANRLTQKGQEGLIGEMNASAYGLASGFDIKPVFKADSSTGAEMKTPLYYENRMIRIIRYVDQDFTLVK
jgi:hypothetical protein